MGKRKTFIHSSYLCNRFSIQRINSRIGKAIPKGDNKWEKGKLLYIGASKDKSELMRMVRAIASMS